MNTAWTPDAAHPRQNGAESLARRAGPIPFALSGVEGSGVEGSRVEGLGQPDFVAVTAPFALSGVEGLGQPDFDAVTAPFALSGVEG